MTGMRIITEPINLDFLRIVAKERFGDMVKAVVDIEQGKMAIGGEMHADEEELLLEKGSMQQNLWGVNLYPDVVSEDWIEFDSMINIRPKQQNRSRYVEDAGVRGRIMEIIKKLVTDSI